MKRTESNLPDTPFTDHIYNPVRNKMNRLIHLATGTMALAFTSAALAQSPPPPPPPPPQPPGGVHDEVNAMILIDVSGSMAEMHGTSGMTRLERALATAKDKILTEWPATDGSLPVEYALWAFDSSFGSGNGWVDHVLDFPASKTAVLAALGFSSTGAAQPSTLDPVFTPTSATPLAGAGCFAGTTLVASLSPTGGLVTAGYEWGKEKSPGVKAEIKRRMFIGTDGLENDTPSSNECYGTTSTQPYESYETTSWQYKLRNKLLTGNPTRTVTADSGLVIDINIIFSDMSTGLSGGGLENSYSSGNPYTTEPTLVQALEFYGGLADNTRGIFKTVTVDAGGNVVSRRPGDVDLSGCVGNNDYAQIVQWYGQAVSPSHPQTYLADLTGDGWVDYLDYLIVYEHWYEGGGPC